MVQLQVKDVCIYIYPSSYDVRVQTIFSKHVLVHMQYENYKLKCPFFCHTLPCHTHHISNDYLCVFEKTPYDLIENILLWNVHHILNGDIFGNEHKSYSLYEIQFELIFFYYAAYINTRDYVCKRQSKNE